MAVTLQHAPSASAIRRLVAADEPVLRRFLARYPSQSAYLLGLLGRQRLEELERSHPMVGWFDGRHLTAVVHIGPNLVLSRAKNLDALAAFAHLARDLAAPVRVVVGPDLEVARFMDSFGRGAVALERGGQVLLEVDQRHLDRGARSLGLRPAQPDELSEVHLLDERMIVEELGFSPFSGDPELHRHGCARRILERRTWVDAIDGELVFKVDQSAVASQVVQLAGVYTRPDVRGRGLAYRAVGEMCHLLLRETPRVSLYVNADNAVARRLYGRLGFRDVGLVRSVWLDPP